MKTICTPSLANQTDVYVTLSDSEFPEADEPVLVFLLSIYMYMYIKCERLFFVE